MTLTKKIALAVLTSFIFIFMITYAITLFNNRTFFIQQMNSNAQDTATSLGLSLSHALSTKDKPTMLSMVQAVFDRGYFSKIEIRNTDNQILVSRYLKERTTTVPSWFMKIIYLPVKMQSSVILDGWLQVGTVNVSSDSSYAYLTLWQSARYLVLVYFIFALIALTCVFLLIHWLMAPMKKVTLQAQSICKKLFPIETKIPKTWELKQVTLAMNQMVRHIKELFEDQICQIETLQKKAFQDSLTQLGNRPFFLQQLSSVINHAEEYSPGFVILIALDGLDQLNKKRGYTAGDKVISLLSETLVRFWSSKPGVNLARITGSNFGLLIREENESQFMHLCLSFNEKIQALPLKDWNCSAIMAAAPYRFQATTSEILKHLDELLIQARSTENRFSFSETMPQKHEVQLNPELLKTALENQDYAFYGQFVVNNEEQYHQELFLRLVIGEYEISAGRFMPLADKLGLASKIDIIMLDKVIEEKFLEKNPVALNLSGQTILDVQACKLYLKKLKTLKEAQRKSLFLEVKESILFEHFEAVKDFAIALQGLSVQFGVDQVGIHFKSEHYLQTIPIHYLKLHECLIDDIENQNKQFLMYYFNKLSKILSIAVIVTGIESENEWEIIQNLGFTLGQGEYLDKVHFIKVHQ